jgi:hypothetical protein
MRNEDFRWLLVVHKEWRFGRACTIIVITTFFCNEPIPHDRLSESPSCHTLHGIVLHVPCNCSTLIGESRRLKYDLGLGCTAQYETNSGSILNDRIARNTQGSLLHTRSNAYEVVGSSHQMQERVEDSSHNRRFSASRESILTCVTVSSELRYV